MPLYFPTLIIVILFLLTFLIHTYFHFKEYKILLQGLLYTLSRKYEHIIPILRSLHWLPIHHRTTFKVLLLTYKILHGQAPKYLSDLISLRSPISLRPLRSSYTLQLTPDPRTASATRYGDRAFSVIAPILWNKLPAHIHNTHSLDQFKTLLKTHFLKYINDI